MRKQCKPPKQEDEGKQVVRISEPIAEIWARSPSRDSRKEEKGTEGRKYLRVSLIQQDGKHHQLAWEEHKNGRNMIPTTEGVGSGLSHRQE